MTLLRSSTIINMSPKYDDDDSYSRPAGQVLNLLP